MTERMLLTSNTDDEFFRAAYGLNNEQIDAVKMYLRECEEEESR